MKDYASKVSGLNVYYPQNFKLVEHNDGVISISNDTTGLEMTISSYDLSDTITAEYLIHTLQGFMKEFKSSDSEPNEWFSYKSDFDNLVFTEFRDQSTYWMWYGISKSERLVVFSINKRSDITKYERGLIKFIIDHLSIH